MWTGEEETRKCTLLSLNKEGKYAPRAPKKSEQLAKLYSIRRPPSPESAAPTIWDPHTAPPRTAGRPPPVLGW
ncbi:hypothetical protein VPH35_116169 [Triticum aestivum]